VRCTRRGVYEVGPLVAVKGDPLGLTQRETIVAEPFELPRCHPAYRTCLGPPADASVRGPAHPTAGVQAVAVGPRVLRDARIQARATTFGGSCGGPRRAPGRSWCAKPSQGITDKITVIPRHRPGRPTPHDGEGLSESFEAGVRARRPSLAIPPTFCAKATKCTSRPTPVRSPVGCGRGQPADAVARRVRQGSRWPESRLGAVIRRLLGNAQRDAHNVLITTRDSRHPGSGPAEACSLIKVCRSSWWALLWGRGTNADTAGRPPPRWGCQVAQPAARVATWPRAVVPQHRRRKTGF